VDYGIIPLLSDAHNFVIVSEQTNQLHGAEVFLRSWYLHGKSKNFRHWNLSWATRIQFTPSHPIYWRFILLISSHLHLYLPSGFFPSGFANKIISEFWLGIFLFTTASTTAIGPTQLPIHWVPGAPSLGVKRMGGEAGHSPPSSAQVEEWVELYLHSPNTTSWCDAQLKAHGQLYLYLTCATFPSHFILLGLIILIIFDELYKLWSSSLCSLLQPSSTSSLLGQIFSSAPCSQTSAICVLHLVWETSLTPIQNNG